MEGFTQWLRQLRFEGILEILLIALASLLCITVHESCHGLAALWLGDDTAKRMKRISLNPLRHIEPVGLLLMVTVRFGWAKPVPIDMRRFRNPKLGMAISALAGPLSNVLLMMISAILRVVAVCFYVKTSHSVFEYLSNFFEWTAVLSAGLAVFNILPIPPLDGSKVMFSLLPQKAYSKLMRYERYGMIVLIALLFSNILDKPLFYLRGVLIALANLVTAPLYDWLLSLL